MTSRVIRVSTRRTGVRQIVRVYVHDTVEELRKAAQAYNGGPAEEYTHTLGITQTFYTWPTKELMLEGRPSTAIDRSNVIIRLARGYLSASIIVHECAHAAAELYGRTLTPDVLAMDVLEGSNETIAHMVSDLTARLSDRLWAHGYYDPPAA